MRRADRRRWHGRHELSPGCLCRSHPGLSKCARLGGYIGFHPGQDHHLRGFRRPGLAQAGAAADELFGHGHRWRLSGRGDEERLPECAQDTILILSTSTTGGAAGARGRPAIRFFPRIKAWWPGAVPDHWKNHDYGIVTWWAHGAPDRTDIGYDKHWVGPLISASDASLLDDSHPAIVFSISCNNGWPENANNLGYSLLKNGAVAVFSSSRMSGYCGGEFQSHPVWGR